MSDEKEVRVQKREECTVVPEGVSCTETEKSYYLRVRRGKAKITVRITKDNFFDSVMSIDEFADFDPTTWHGAWGTKG
jgi:hypothetical protein